jgi:hypothetical protein
VRLTGLTGVEPLSESCPVSPAGTGLTGGAHRSDRCWSVDSRFGVPLRSRVGRVCVLVPRSSGTPVGTWARPTWVVSRRRVLEAVFIFLEFPSLSRRIFYRLPFTPPPLWFAVLVLHRHRLSSSRRRPLDQDPTGWIKYNPSQYQSNRLDSAFLQESPYVS